MSRRMVIPAMVGISLIFTACHRNSKPGVESNPTHASVEILPGGHIFPGVRLPDRVIPSHYDIDLDIYPERGEIVGSTQIRIHLKEKTDTIWMHGWDLDMAVSKVILPGGKAVAAHYQEYGDWGEVILKLDREIPAGDATLHFEYTGRLWDDLLGPYLVEEDGAHYVITQFQDAYARRAFPSFDEPALKATFSMAITAKADDIVVANAPEIGEGEARGTRIRHQFEKTPAISPYLVAFATGPFDVVEAPPIAPSDLRPEPIPLRGLAAKGKGEDLKEVLTYAPALLTDLEAYFDLPYAYKKLDLMAVVDFEAGAMENPGLITFREPLLLLDENASLSDKTDVAVVLSHELAHQWFGNLVTMDWWDDLWLNESFAEWMGYRLVESWRPEMSAALSMASASFGVMDTDSARTATPMRRPIQSYHDITTAFDGISYEKGAGVLSMFERLLGPDTFRDGVRLYMKEYAGKSAEMNDLLASLSEAAAMDITMPFRTFVVQPGVPFLQVDVQCHEDLTQLTARQSRYFPLGVDGAQSQNQWQIPFCVRYAVGGEEDEQCTLLTESISQLTLDAQGCPDWVFPNGAGAGYYRWSLDDEALDALSQRAYPHLDAAEKLAYADSLSAAFSRGDMDYARAAELMLPLAQDSSRQAVHAPINLLVSAHDILVTEAERPRVAAEVRRVFTEPLKALKAAEAAGQGTSDAHQRELLRLDIEELLAEVGMDPKLRAAYIHDAKAYTGFEGDGQIHPEMVEADRVTSVLTVAVQDLGAPFFDHLLGLLKASQDGRQRAYLVSGLAGTTDGALRERLLAMMLDGTLRTNEWSRLMMSHLSYVENRDPLWQWMKANLDSLVEKSAAHMIGFYPWIGAGFCDEHKARELREVLTPVVEKAPGGMKNLDQVSEIIGMCAAFKSAHGAETQAYFSTLSADKGK